MDTTLNGSLVAGTGRKKQRAREGLDGPLAVRKPQKALEVMAEVLLGYLGSYEKASIIRNELR